MGKNRKWIALAMTICVVAASLNTVNFRSDQSEHKNYVVVTKKGAGRNVTTCSISAADAERMKRSKNVLVVEEEGYVRGSSESFDWGNEELKDDSHEKETYL